MATPRDAARRSAVRGCAKAVSQGPWLGANHALKAHVGSCPAPSSLRLGDSTNAAKALDLATRPTPAGPGRAASCGRRTPDRARTRARVAGARGRPARARSSPSTTNRRGRTPTAPRRARRRAACSPDVRPAPTRRRRSSKTAAEPRPRPHGGGKPQASVDGQSKTSALQFHARALGCGGRRARDPPCSASRADDA